ncbi:uncharacterized protein B0I36DRAFT_354699 [Microdochium trichocladiopsis]|uniref:Secreted protein n=1 Tax=Microdochium trichocladiopsis TaxID=1682393 RepID=A0A9P9BHE9_9PEZI|nr:uncharacterized protein B0I36DRAFT_354699 [Microdochium trichocladiopsis]KAH7018419.1 hypothetical protein B0I36DRAFT_354699 [Microdochium trichocladiopsis]
MKRAVAPLCHCQLAFAIAPCCANDTSKNQAQHLRQRSCGYDSPPGCVRGGSVVWARPSCGDSLPTEVAVVTSVVPGTERSRLVFSVLFAEYGHREITSKRTHVGEGRETALRRTSSVIGRFNAAVWASPI